MRRRFINNRHVAYNQTEYLSFEALEDGFVLTFPQNLKYSINGGVWKNLPSYTRTKPINSGDIISLQGDCEIFTYEGVGTFNFNKKCNVFGNILSIIGYKNLQAHAFVNLFANGTIVDSSNLILPIDLTVFCYSNMFYNCKSLVKAPELPATTLADDCYGSMFYGCTSLKEAPELPATTLARYCYGSMFSNCTSLVNAPELPATQLVNYCYNEMFYGCIKLKYIKMLAMNVLGTNCLYKWVYNVSPTGTFVKNKDATWDTTPGALGTNGVPAGWTVVNDGEEGGGLINFTIDGTSYQAEEGMTWEEWVNSSYNTDGYYRDKYGDAIRDRLHYFVGTNEDYVLPQDVIIEGYEYLIVS